jgi:hypothetical protein
MAGLQEVPELKAPSTATIDGGPQEVPELASGSRARSAYGARHSGRAVNGCINLGTNAQRVFRTHFTLTQVGHFC